MKPVGSIGLGEWGGSRLLVSHSKHTATVKAYVLLIVISLLDGDVKPGGNLGAFR